MKRIVAILAVVMMLMWIVGIASAEDFARGFSNAIGGIETEYNLGDILLIICDYDKLISADADITNQTEEYRDSLLSYEKILILCMKNGEAYLVIEMPLVDGVFIENTGNPLMSRKYLLENMTIGN